MKTFDAQESDLLLEFLTEYFEEFDRFAADNGFEKDLVMQIIDNLKDYD
ncbi:MULTISPECIES: hypothetical protein [Neisseria]|uniref:Uncharacterized protein n=1 Tax=Neisseria zoodegmatis TaxID=326523 RepID=A0A378WHZ0_9NEIS|nr:MULTISPECIES: hypothetical protein [Neisseria]SUA36335.1 Uncharacterised protein [Neisseria zoodegmatis]